MYDSLAASHSNNVKIVDGYNKNRILLMWYGETI
jgi:hypothetical protein